MDLAALAPGKEPPLAEDQIRLRAVILGDWHYKLSNHVTNLYWNILFKPFHILGNGYPGLRTMSWSLEQWALVETNNEI